VRFSAPSAFSISTFLFYFPSFWDENSISKSGNGRQKMVQITVSLSHRCCLLILYLESRLLIMRPELEAWEDEASPGSSILGWWVARYVCVGWRQVLAGQAYWGGGWPVMCVSGGGKSWPVRHTGVVGGPLCVHKPSHKSDVNRKLNEGIERGNKKMRRQLCCVFPIINSVGMLKDGDKSIYPSLRRANDRGR
jgi:hypothetical protein